MDARPNGKLFGLAAVQFAGYAATLGWNVIAARVCSIHLYGVISLAVSLVIALQVLLEMGHQRTLVRFLSPLVAADMNRAEESLRRRALIVPLVLGGLLGLGVYLTHHFAADASWGGASITEWLMIAPAGVGAALMNVQAGAYVAAGRAVASSVLGLTAAPVSICVALWLIGRSGEATGGPMLLAVTAPYMIGGIFSLWKLATSGRSRAVADKVALPVSELPSKGEFYSFAWKAMVVGLVSLGLGYVDRYILGAFASFAAVGLYSLPARAARLLNVPVYFLNPLAGPAYAAAHQVRHMHDALAVFRASSKFIGTIVLPLGAVAAVYAKQILVLIGGQEYGAASTAMSILVVGVLALTLSGNSSLLLQMAGREGAEVKCGLIGLVTNVAVALVLLRPLGIVGVAIGTASGFVVTSVARYLVCRAAWGLVLADLLRPNQMLGVALQAAVAAMATYLNVGWLTAAPLGVVAFVMLNPPWVSLRELEYALDAAASELKKALQEAGANA
jgi:O-antigen/teichoic acid export membrane protein